MDEYLELDADSDFEFEYNASSSSEDNYTDEQNDERNNSPIINEPEIQHDVIETSDNSENTTNETAGPSRTIDENDHDRDEEESVIRNDGESDTSSDNTEMDINIISKLFVKRLKKYGISQRQAAKLILGCSQSNLSEAITKAKRLKTSKEISARGLSIYKQMDKWLADKAAQSQTVKSNAQHKAGKPQKKQSQASKGKKGTHFSFVQLSVLVELFKKNNRPSVQRKTLISETLDLDINQVNTWFNNQRARNFSAEKQVERMRKDGQKPVIPQAWNSLLSS